jgi:hypothetical protein
VFNEVCFNTIYQDKAWQKTLKTFIVACIKPFDKFAAATVKQTVTFDIFFNRK